ncbi:hypothetical protein E0L36_11240 [Streptomyces sp. AJS327]|uniref:hypothetical protein n=1 Tax=Streptomyces sp. AJS327 TaxID=2545265 RepID=UPI0015DF1F03|nr:hypothetical protein [Streptomyces sp. AJS327]MBA0051445.1 hypothetical protein [Streptomyces sp. AJS327]
MPAEHTGRTEPVDPTDPETLADPYEDEFDRYEEEPDLEAPREDTAEQHAELLRQHDTPITGRGVGEADPADAAEQARVVEDPEEEYR